MKDYGMTDCLQVPIVLDLSCKSGTGWAKLIESIPARAMA
jgi:hypothetical protein